MADRTCFVIMPFGDKLDPASGTVVPFDDIYDYIIEPAVAMAATRTGDRFECIRCDREELAGWIHSRMIKRIFESDVAIVDLTTSNPNVFYELGVRHGLRPSVTVLIRKVGTAIPFNINGFSVVEYDVGLGQSRKAVEDIAEVVAHSLRSSEPDSLVYTVMPDLHVGLGAGEEQRRPVDRSAYIVYQFRRRPSRQIGVVTGDLRRVSGIDVWVNAENTNMQMARYYDRSVSGLVRYLGAERNAAGHVVKDTIADELNAAMGGSFAVPPGHVMVTTPGRLEARGVKLLLHAAVVEGTVGGGYRPIDNLSQCVDNVFERLDQCAAELGLRSVLIPLFGTGTGSGDVAAIAIELLATAKNHLESHADCHIERVMFLAQREDQRRGCLAALSGEPALEPAP